MPNPYDFGAKGDGVADDEGPLRAMFKAGGGTIPKGRFAFTGQLFYGDGFRLTDWQGDLLYRGGGASAAAICTADRTRITKDVVIDASAGGRILYTGPSTRPRKGLSIGWTDGFEITRVRVIGGHSPVGINLWGHEYIFATHGKISDCLSAVDNGGQQGDDGYHLLPGCARLDFLQCEAMSGDDSFSATCDDPRWGTASITEITVRNCSLNNLGHSAFKLLVTQAGATIARIRLVNNDLKTTQGQQGAGAPIWLHASAGTIEDVAISGGRVRSIIPTGGQVGGPVLDALGVRGLDFSPAQVDHFSRQLAVVQGCPGARITPGVVTSRPAPKPSRPAPFVDVRGSPGTVVRPGLLPAYVGQAAVAIDGVVA